MSVSVKDNTPKVIASIERSANLAIRYMLEDIHEISDPITPKKEGNLRANVKKTVQGKSGQIRWGQRYAKKMETIQFRNYTTAGTGPHYAERAVRSASKSPRNAMIKARLI